MKDKTEKVFPDVGGAQPRRERAGGPRHWYRTTGLTGHERAGLGMPAFGDPKCSTCGRRTDEPRMNNRKMHWLARIAECLKVKAKHAPPENDQQL